MMQQPVEIFVQYDFDENDGDFDYTAITDAVGVEANVFLTAYGPDPVIARDKLLDGLKQLGIITSDAEAKILDDTGQLEEE